MLHTYALIDNDRMIVLAEKNPGQGSGYTLFDQNGVEVGQTSTIERNAVTFTMDDQLNEGHFPIMPSGKIEIVGGSKFKIVPE